MIFLKAHSHKRVKISIFAERLEKNTMTGLPEDPFILLSTINTMLRDSSESPEEICSSAGWEWEDICERLASAGFEYNADTKRFW